MVFAEFLPLAAETLAHLLPHGTGVDQLNLTAPLFQLAIGQYPDVRTDARVVEHVERRRVVEKLPGLLEQEQLGIQACRFPLFLFLQHRLFSGLQDAVQSPENRKRQNPLP